MNNRSLVIGIAGPSSSGKSTLATRLASELDAAHLCLDDYFIPAAAREVVNGRPSFEQPSQYDGDLMAEEVSEACAKGPVVAEGFLLFVYPALLNACHVRFLISLDDEAVVSRRKARRHAGAGRSEKAERAFDAHGIQEWQRFGAPQSSLPGVIQLDGAMPPDQILSIARSHIHRGPQDVPRGTE